MRVICAE